MSLRHNISHDFRFGKLQGTVMLKGIPKKDVNDFDDCLGKEIQPYCPAYQNVPGTKIGNGQKLTVTYVDGRVETYNCDANGGVQKNYGSYNGLGCDISEELIPQEERSQPYFRFK
jgi:hypothetical protein